MSPFVEAVLAGILSTLGAGVIGWVFGRGGRALLMASSAWQSAPAGSREGQLGRLVRSTVTPADELSEASGSPPDAIGRDRNEHGHFAPGNRIARDKKVRSGPRGALAMLEASGKDEAWLAAARWGRRYSSHRRAELARAHGGELSAGVGTIIESAADLLADARYWRAKAIASCDPELSRLAAQLTAQARGCERDAWELAAREAAVRSRPTESAVDRMKRELAEQQPRSKWAAGSDEHEDEDERV